MNKIRSCFKIKITINFKNKMKIMNMKIRLYIKTRIKTKI